MRICPYRFCVLDIETSTYYNAEGNPLATWLAYGQIALYDIADALPLRRYHFRKWGEFKEALNEMASQFMDYQLIVYVHNLAYDFDFVMKNVARPTKILCNSSHGLIMAEIEGFPNFRFHCTYKLTMQPLRKIGESLNFPKGDIDYRFILPSDSITDEEWQYNDRDCDIVASYIVNVSIKEFGTLRNIPVTKTGRVRKKFKEFYREAYKDIEPTWDFYPPADCYDALINAFAGGLAIDNPMFVGRMLYNVRSFDIKSSYPYAMLKEMYPSKIAREYDDSNWNLNAPFYIIKIKLLNIRAKYAWGWLSVSKMTYSDELTSEYFNGKLLYSSHVERYVTNIDFDLIKQTYNFDYEIMEYYSLTEIDYLPEPYIKTIDYFAQNKDRMSKIVHATSKEDPNYLQINIDYMLSKNDFNSIYGMAVQKLIQAEYKIGELFEWEEVDYSYTQKKGHLYRNFIYGIYITAYARRNLLRAILKNCPYTFVKSDTDSIKFLGDTKFIDTNEKLGEPFSSVHYLRKLGTYENETEDLPNGTYEQFLTWGAKKYAVIENGHCYLTVAGLPKNSHDKIIRDGVMKKFEGINDFLPNTIFYHCKNAKKYIYQDMSFESDTGFEVENLSESQEGIDFMKSHGINSNGGIAIFPASYKLDITLNDRRILEKCQSILKNYLEALTTQNIHITECVSTKLLIT